MRRRILLDECLPRDLRNSFSGHEVTTVPEAGWASKENGELLELAAAEFDIFVTVDRNLTFQQNLADLRIAVIVLVARGNRLVDLQPLIPSFRDALVTIQRGQVVWLDR